MSRPKQDGLKYFSLDTDFFYADKRIKRLHSRFGNDGLIFFIYLLTEIYRVGYYARWDEDLIDDALGLNFTEGFIEQVMSFLVSRSLLVKRILTGPDTGITIQKEGDGRPQCELAGDGDGQKKVTVITSPGIQRRYQEAVKSLRRDIYVDADIWLLDSKETACYIKVTHFDGKSEKNPDKSGKNESKSRKNPINKKKLKEMKGNEIKPKETKGNNTKTAAPQYYPDELLNQAFLDFMEMRKKIRKPMTDRAVTLAMNKLKELSSVSGSMDNDIAIKILEQSTMNCWQGIFPLRKTGSGRGNEYDEWRDA